jgi:glutaminase A-like protein/uncharacterized protein DUF5127/uncharacterized protein DUF4964
MISHFKAFLFSCLALLAGIAQAVPPPVAQLRPPAVPLVTCDPYFSVWSFADRLTDDTTRHWTGASNALEGLVRIDGKTYRILGVEPKKIPALTQVDLKVLPTRTIYKFEGQGVRVTLTFATPLLASDLDILSRPVTYLTWQVESTDNRQHAVSLYYGTSAELVVNKLQQSVVWSREKIGRLTALKMGSQQQPILAKSGDNLRIDWGYLYVAAPNEASLRQVISSAHSAQEKFVANGTLASTDDLRMPRAADDDRPVMAFAFDLGKVGAEPVSRHLLLAYDDLYSIEYFHHRLRPYWRRQGAGAAELLGQAEKDYRTLTERCEAFDQELMTDLERIGGPKYARLAALAYRQSLAAHKLVADEKGNPLFFPKENFSNGCIATVDVIYPAAPILLLFNTRLLRASMVPVFDYAASGRWHFPFAPHDLGTYPLANGQVYGGREQTEKDQMPVEESGNMIILTAAIAKAEGNAGLAQKYWPLLTQWAGYLKQAGLDPANQLCTDDFAGHLAHNANLSLKAIEALGAYAMLCEMLGKRDEAALYRNTAQEFARQWVSMADDGDHYRLAFDKPGTWSQKYNLVWDTLLGFKLFPPQVAVEEIAFYQKKMNRFGLPLDNRKGYTKLDWEIWTATLAESPADFQALVAVIYDWLNQTSTRVPLTDWYRTTDGRQAGFQARSVVGGIYIKMLSDPTMWKKWSSRAK